MFCKGEIFLGALDNSGWEWEALSDSEWLVTKDPGENCVGIKMPVRDIDLMRWLSEGAVVRDPEHLRKVSHQISADHSEYYSAITEVDHEPV